MSTASNNRTEAHSGSGSGCRPESFLTGSGAAYLAGRYGLGVLVSLGNMLVLTWWIGPHAYGIFVTGIGLVAFLSSLARVGVDTYLVRREAEPDERVYGVAASVVLAVSVALGLMGVALAPPMVRWFGSREFVAPYLALLLSVPVIGLTGIPTAKLERELNFRRLAGIEVAGQFLGLLVSSVMARLGFKVWAAVAGQTAWQVFLLVSAYISAGLVPRFRLDAIETRKMLTYGMSVTVALRTWQMRALVNPLLVGRFGGAESVAFVALAIRIAEASGSIRSAAGRVAIASLARLQKDREGLRQTLEQSLSLQVMVLGPLLCVFTLFGVVIVQHVIGIRWMTSLTVYPFIAAGVLVNSVYNLQASALFVSGRPWVVMRAYVVHVTSLAAATYLLLPHFGIVGYGWAELLACAGYAPIHRAFARTLSYGKLMPWLALFFGIIFLPVASTSRISTSFVALAVVLACWKIAATQSQDLWAVSRWIGRRFRPAVSISGLLVLAMLTVPRQAFASSRHTAVKTRASETIPSTFFGIHFRMDKVDWPNLPFGTLRLWDTDTNWQKLNPERGRYDFSNLDRYLAASKEHHLSDVMLTLGSTPAWASSNPLDETCDYADFAPGSCHPPFDLKADGSGPNRLWCDFVYRLGSHLAALDRTRHTPVSYISIWNEFTRGLDSQHRSWLGTDQQLSRMARDANCILRGRGSTQPCTAASVGEPAVSLLPDITMVTPDAVPQPPGLGGLVNYLNSKAAMSLAGVIAVHTYAYGGTGETAPDAGQFGLVKQWSEMQRLLPANHDLPIWSTEGGWGDTQRNLANPDLQVGYIARYYLVGWSLGFRRLYWYAADNSWGRLIHQSGNEGCNDHGTRLGCPTRAALAWTQVYRWMVGKRMTKPCAPQRSSSVWTCELLKPDRTKLLAVWDVSQTCANGRCTSSNYKYPVEYSHYFTLEDAEPRRLSQGTIQIGWKPILLSQGSMD